jgi:quinol monooxygenase YgiN
MIAKALLARFEARLGQDDMVRQLLLGALPAVRAEAGTLVWFALRFGRGEYAIFDCFADEAGRQAHLQGEVAKALVSAKDTLLDDMPDIQPVDVLAHKLPSGELDDVAKGLLLTFKAKTGHEAEVAAFLRDARRYVDEEPGTRAWFALQIGDRHFGIFDVFPDQGARFAHLTGHVPRELAKHAFSLLGGMPDMHMADVVVASSRGG